MIVKGIISLVAVVVCCGRSLGASITVEPISNPPGVTIAVRPQSPVGWSLLQVVDPRTGQCLRTLHAGRISPQDHFAVVTSDALAAGSYRLRYREGMKLELAGHLRRPDPKIPQWIDPTDLALAGPWVYVLDAGENVEAKTPELAAQRAAKQPCIFKMDRAGKLDASFAEGGRLPLPDTFVHAFAVDPDDGKIFVSRMGHEVRVFDSRGAPTKQAVGGYDGDGSSPKSTPYCDPIALGFKNRIYIPAPVYRGKVYDRTKNAFDGILYSFDIADAYGYGRLICSDMQGCVYHAGGSQRITRWVDDGKSVKPTYQSDETLKLAKPTGGSASAGLVWWACHGPGFGPYWDSGGGGEVVLFWDTGKSLTLIDRFGVPGTAADRMEFLNPCAAVMDAAHDELWVLEDGKSNPEGPRGNARVRRFALRARYSEDAKFDLPDQAPR